MEKDEFRVLLKHYFVKRKILLEQKLCLILVIQTQLHREIVKMWFTDFKRKRKNTDNAERSGQKKWLHGKNINKVKFCVFPS